jgi:hypothetical protein
MDTLQAEENRFTSVLQLEILRHKFNGDCVSIDLCACVLRVTCRAIGKHHILGILSRSTTYFGGSLNISGKLHPP